MVKKTFPFRPETGKIIMNQDSEQKKIELAEQALFGS
jgi:hypothetical protein